MKRYFLYVVAVFLVIGMSAAADVTTGTLIDDMVDLERLTRYPDPAYKTIQFSSYDRNSTQPGEGLWFSNSDGSGVEAVLKAKEGDAPGEYLLCDIEGPGAIVRMWTAEISGTIRLTLDGSETPLYEGPAKEFLRRPYDRFLGGAGLAPEDIDGVFYQRDASYAPIPFAKRCRIVWIGDKKDVHFYHIQARVYEPGTPVVSFTPADLSANVDRIRRVASVFANPDAVAAAEVGAAEARIDVSVAPGAMKDGLRLQGPGTIRELTLKLEAPDLERALRQTIMRIQFDRHPWGQIEAPVGDFFGAGPGIVPFVSVPFTVRPDGTMICRYVMPYESSARFIFDNRGDQSVRVTGTVSSVPYQWDAERSMHFRARWRIDHGLTAVNKVNQGAQDLPYLMARGKGVYVGTAIMVLNPTVIPTTWGGWWGEGDEKIFVDDDIFPSTYGTGSEDYFNYSWSAFDVFQFPYFGQPRDDGPANRGFIVNQRWHVLDPLPFTNSLAFYMELASHDPTPGVAYGRISYLYGRPGMMDDHVTITDEDVRHQALPATWEPESRFGSKGLVFTACEDMVAKPKRFKFETNGLWQGGRIMIWTPKKVGETLELPFHFDKDGEHPITLTCMLKPGAGAFRVTLDGGPILLSGKEEFDLDVPHFTMSRMYANSIKGLKAGEHVLTLTAKEAGKPIGLDFFGTRK